MYSKLYSRKMHSKKYRQKFKIHKKLVQPWSINALDITFCVY